MKCINLMTLYKTQPCLTENTSYIEIRKVYDKKKRMGRPIGDINLTDYWFELVESEKELQGKYAGQHFCLLSDESGEEEQYWEKQNDKRVEICLIKIRSEFQQFDRTFVQEMVDVALQKEECSDWKFFYSVDNADLVLFIFEEKRKNMRELLKTLQSLNVSGETIFYSFYSLGGKIQIKKKDPKSWCIIKEPTSMLAPFQYKNDLYEKGWCLSKITELQKKMDICVEQKNRKWASYYHALRQILNLLSQYEQEEKFKDLFYIFYPSMRLFLKQLEKGLDLNEESPEKLEKAVSDFVDSMEILIHHIGISCSNILNLERNNGLPYDIPMKLCMLYLATLHAVVKVFNDDNHEYQFCLSPLAYSRPTTSIFDFGLEPGDRLIRVSIARHMLYSPRALLAIMTHEVSHYVGKCRERKERAEHYILICALIVVESIFPYEEVTKVMHRFALKEAEQNALWNNFQEIKAKMVSYFETQMIKGINQSDIPLDYRYHFTELYEEIKKITKELLYDKENKLEYYMNEVHGELRKQLTFMGAESKLLDAYRAVRDILGLNLLKTALEGGAYEQMHDVKYALRETYADISAILLLEIRPQDYLEDYLLSEGCVPDERKISNMLQNRVALVHSVISEVNMDWEKEWNNLNPETLNQNSFLIELKNKVDNYLCMYEISKHSVGKLQFEERTDVSHGKKENKFDPFLTPQIIEQESIYLTGCVKQVQDRIRSKEVSEEVEVVRTLYAHLAEAEGSSFEKFFRNYDKIVAYFKKDVKETWMEVDSTG